MELISNVYLEKNEEIIRKKCKYFNEFSFSLKNKG